MIYLFLLAVTVGIICLITYVPKRNLAYRNDPKIEGKIDELLRRRYNNYYTHKDWYYMRELHRKIRTEFGNVPLLELLEKLEIENPTPTYDIPESYKIQDNEK